MPTSYAASADASDARPATRLDAITITRIAPRALGHAAFVGIAADMLLRQGIDGAAFPVWISILILSFVSLTWHAQREFTGGATLWLYVAALSSCGLAWRDAGILKFLDVVATLGALAMAAIALASPRAGILAERFRDLLWMAFAAIPVMILGIAPNLVAALGEARGRREWESGSRRMVRSALLAAGMLVVFGSLLRRADPIFASLVSLPDFDLGVAFSHVVVVGVIAWIFCGWANSALGSALTSAIAPTRLPFSLDTGDLASSLGVLNVLFAAFMIAQLGWLFGGDAFLRARTGLTAAQYARSGFFEMIWVVVLVIPLLVLTRAALVPGKAVERRHTVLSIPLLLLLAGIIASAAGRMQLYVHYYGLTTYRLYTLVFMGWLAFVLAWLAMTVLRGAGRAFIAGCAVSAYLVLVALNVAAPDAVVAAFNEQRASTATSTAGADLRHLSELSGEAVDVAIRRTLASPSQVSGSDGRTELEHGRCEAARRLLRRWGPESRAAESAEAQGAWARWNAGSSRALRLVATDARGLRAVVRSSCANARRSNAG